MKLFKSKQVNNKGFSLVELIVTILIVAIISGGAVVSIGVVYNANTDRAAKRLVTALSEVREQAMAGEEEYTFFLRLYKDGENVMADICKDDRSGAAYTVLETKEIGNKQVTIGAGLKDADDASFNTLVASGDFSELYFAFGKRRGELTNTGYMKDDGTVATTAGEDNMFLDIMVWGNTDKKVIIVPATGRSYIYKDTE